MRPINVRQTEIIFRERFLPLYPRLFTLAQAILGTENGEAADVVQEVMVKIWKSGEKMSEVDSPARYAASLTRTTAIDMMRRHHGEEMDVLPDKPASPMPEPDTAEFLERMIDTLPPGQQMVIRLSAFDDLPPDRIAEITGLTPANVRQLLSRGRKKLRILYSKYMQQ